MGWFEAKVAQLSPQYEARMQIHGSKLDEISYLSGGISLRLDIINPALMNYAALGGHEAPDFWEREPMTFNIVNNAGIPGTMFEQLRTKGVISPSGESLHVDKLADHLARRFYLRSNNYTPGQEEFILRPGEERTAQNMFQAVLGRLAGRSAIIPKYGVFEGEVIDAVHSLITTVQPADGHWHPPLDQWNERKFALDNRGISVDLSGLPFRNKDLSLSNLSRVIFTGCDLEGSDLSEACLAFSDVSYAFMQNVDLVDAVCPGLSASHTDFNHADLGGIDARTADFSWANLESANMERGDFSGADFNGSQVMFSNPFRALFIGARIDGALPVLTNSLYDAAIANHSEHIYQYMMEVASQCSSPSAVISGLLKEEHKLGYIPGRLGIVGLTALRQPPDPAQTVQHLKDMVMAAYIGKEMREGISPRLSKVEPAAKLFAGRLALDGEMAMAKYLVLGYISAIVTREMMHSFYSIGN